MMDLMALSFPFAEPGAQVAVQIGPVSLRWYGLAYLAGLLLGWLYMRRLCAEPRLWAGGASPMRPELADDFLLWATIGTVVGGRLGFVLFYEPSLFLSDPLRVFKVWEGGMAFHGGLLGVGVAVWIFARWNGVPVRSLMDLSAAAVPFGLFFGRIANFINGEVYGRIADVPWAVVFPQHLLSPGDAVGPRHPTQLYEAFLEGIVMFAILRWLTHSRLALHRPGTVAGTFLVVYGLFRIFVEFFKEWDETQFFTTPWFSEAMVYCLPMIAFGVWLIVTAQPARLHGGASVRRA